MASGAEPSDDATVTFRGPPLRPAVPAADRFVHQLLLLTDDGPARRIALDNPPLVIGRTPPAGLVLEGGTVSRRHCMLEAAGDSIAIADLGSTNGTFVDGTRIEGPVVLADGAEIDVGIYRLRYQRRHRAEAAEAAAIDDELQQASNYVASILPPPIDGGPVEVEWFYQPSTRLGGDAFGYRMLDQSRFAIFVLDVSGHGAGAALHAVTVANTLRQGMLPGVAFDDPAAVIESLNRVFPMEQHNGLFFTIWYGVYDIATRTLRYAAGGHHAGYLIPPGAGDPVPLAIRNPAVGMLVGRPVATAAAMVPPGSALSLFTDGVFEIVDRQGQQWGLGHILPLLPVTATKGGPRALFDHVRSVARPGLLDDDFSVVTARFP
jgi:serine phosphatase RsbU (regulator of sigma subunit)